MGAAFGCRQRPGGAPTRGTATGRAGCAGRCAPDEVQGSDRDVDAGFAQAQRVGMGLRAVPEHGNLAPANDGKVSVCVIEELGHDVKISLLDVMKRNFGFG